MHKDAVVVFELLPASFGCGRRSAVIFNMDAVAFASGAGKTFLPNGLCSTPFHVSMVAWCHEFCDPMNAIAIISRFPVFLLNQHIHKNICLGACKNMCCKAFLKTSKAQRTCNNSKTYYNMLVKYGVRRFKVKKLLLMHIILQTQYQGCGVDSREKLSRRSLSARVRKTCRSTVQSRNKTLIQTGPFA